MIASLCAKLSGPQSRIKG